MSLLKYRLIKLDSSILYQLEFSNLKPFRIKYKAIHKGEEISLIVDSGSASSTINKDQFIIGITKLAPSSRTFIYFFKDDEERDLYYELYKLTINKFIETYKQEFNIS